MKLTKKLTLILIAFALNVNAQEYKLGKVTVAELEEKQHPKDPSAAAAILFETGDVRFEYSQNEGFEKFLTVRTKIKIYKKEGYEQANASVQYYVGTNESRESVSFNNAVTYNLVNGKIEKTKLRSDGEFDEKSNKYWNVKKITMPNVKEGSVIEFEYTVKSPWYRPISDWAFQTSIPVNYSEFKTQIPEYYVFTSNLRGFITPKVTTENNSKSFTIMSKERSGINVSNTTFTSDKIDYIETKTTYVAENLPAMKDEDYVNNIDNYTTTISHEFSMRKMPNRAIETFSTDWESVVKTVNENDDFGPELNKTGYFEDDVTALLKGLTTDEEKIATIFSFVKSKVKWNDYYGYSCNDGVKKAYKDGVGNVAEINLMLTAMLRFANINANPVLISTRNNGIAYFPSLSAFNYVIVAAETAEGTILLDATEKYSSPNILPTRDLNWFGRLIRKDKTSSEIDLMPKTISREVVILNYSVLPTGIIEGKVKKQYTNNSALNFRKTHLGTNKDSYLENLEKKYNNLEINEYLRENDTDLNNPLTEIYNFKCDNTGVEIIGDKIYLSPLLFLTTKENPFKQETREYPVDFGFPTQSRYSITIDLPAGYAIESLPKQISLSAGEEIGNLKYIIAESENKIQMVLTETINAAIVPADYYDTLKDFFKQLVAKENEKIVLKKI